MNELGSRFKVQGLRAGRLAAGDLFGTNPNVSAGRRRRARSDAPYPGRVNTMNGDNFGRWLIGCTQSRLEGVFN